MSFADWVNNGWLVAHKSSKQEIGASGEARRSPAKRR
jgi:hypothetical protein